MNKSILVAALLAVALAACGKKEEPAATAPAPTQPAGMAGMEAAKPSEQAGMAGMSGMEAAKPAEQAGMAAADAGKAAVEAGKAAVEAGKAAVEAVKK